MTKNDHTGLLYRKAVRDRLNGWILAQYDSYADFQRKTEIDHSALRRCRHPYRPQLPSGAILATIAAKTDLSLHYLFTGEGPENQGELLKEADLAQALRAHLLNAVRRLTIPDKFLKKGKPLLREVVKLVEERALLGFAAGIIAGRPYNPRRNPRPQDMAVIRGKETDLRGRARGDGHR